MDLTKFRREVARAASSKVARGTRVAVFAIVFALNISAEETHHSAGYTDPFPSPAQRGESSQPAETIVLSENFENAQSKVPGLVGNAWKAKNEDALPLVYPIS